MRRASALIKAIWIAVWAAWTAARGTGTLLRRRRPPFGVNRLAVCTVVAAMLYLAAGASAFFTSTGTGIVTASSTTLAAPTAVSASAAGPAAVSVSWTGTTTPAGGAVTGYYVQRFTGSTPSPACGSSVTALLPAATTSCMDTGNPAGLGVPAGTYTYQVVAVWRSWSTPSSASSAVTVQGPSLTSASPSSADQGATNDNVTITGTNFVSGATAAFSGTGIIVNSTTYVSATQLTANITILGTATTGTRM
jgi:hypothetical protein